MDNQYQDQISDLQAVSQPDSEGEARSTPLSPTAKIERAMNKVAASIAFVGVLGMIAVSLLTTFNVVVMRWIINSPIPGSNEFYATIFAVSVACVLPGVLVRKASLEVDLISNWVGPSAVRLLRQIGHALMFTVMVLIAWQSVLNTIEAYEQGSATIILQWRLWPYFSVITAVLIFCVPAQLVAYFSSARGTDEDEGLAINFSSVTLLLGAMTVFALIIMGAGHLQPFASQYPISVSLIMFVVLWVLILAILPVSVVLVICGLVGTTLLMNFSSAMSILRSETSGVLTSTDLAVIPLFVLMGGFATAAGLSNDVYRLAHAAFGWLRGGLAHATIGGCAGFGALTGSSLATVATMGRVALPEMRARGYAPALSSGCIAAGGTLGQLVPPSTAIVLYALLTDSSIGTLYIAVLIPALLTIVLYMTTITIWVRLKPEAAPQRTSFNIAEFVLALRKSGLVITMFSIVIGGIYFGVFTANEAAAVGAAFAFFSALFRGKLNRHDLLNVVVETTTSAGLIYFLIIGAFVLTFFTAASGLPDYLTGLLAGSQLPPVIVVSILVVFIIILGCVMDSFTIMIVTAPLAASILTHIGYDLNWWGVVMIVLVELGVVTPPFGMNLFMMKVVDPAVPLRTIFAGSLPFVMADTIKVILLIAFPWLVLWLPHTALK